LPQETTKKNKNWRFVVQYIVVGGRQTMKLTQFFREQLDREVERSRKPLEQAPEGKYE